MRFYFAPATLILLEPMTYRLHVQCEPEKYPLKLFAIFLLRLNIFP